MLIRVDSCRTRVDSCQTRVDSRWLVLIRVDSCWLALILVYHNRLDLKNEKSFEVKLKTFFLVSKVLFFGLRKRTSNNVTDATFKFTKFMNSHFQGARFGGYFHYQLLMVNMIQTGFQNDSVNTWKRKGPRTRIQFFEIFLKFKEKHYFNNISTCSMKLFR